MNENGKYSIALIDDDRVFLVSLKNSLQQQFNSSLSISEYHSGEEFIRNIENTPDIVILDYYLNDYENPEAMNGMHVLHDIKSALKDSIVIMLSGQDKVDVAMDCLRNGAYEYISKSESAFVRIPNSIKNAIANIKSKKESNNYIKLKINKTIVLGAIILIDVIGYCIFHFIRS
jgi:two-component system, OmpR family, response regulator